MTTTTSPDGTPIGFEQTGTGNPLVLVDGALGYRAGGPSGPLAALLASEFTVFTYDRRARGESGDTQPYAVEREVEDLAAVIGEAGGSAGVYGTSSGARLALQAAVQGVEMSALALWEPNFIVDDSRAPLPSDYVSHLEELVGAGKREEAVEYFLTQGAGIPAEFVAQMRGTPPMAWMGSVAHTLAYDARVVDGMILRPDVVAAVSTQTLVLDGGTTPWLSAGAHALTAAMPSATHREITGQQHDVQPDAIAPALIEFFSKAGS
ncbi:MAG: hydrolase [Pseudonocardia sp.]|nr:hydrolase [Pseudonocardia sp.]